MNEPAGSGDAVLQTPKGIPEVCIGSTELPHFDALSQTLF